MRERKLVERAVTDKDGLIKSIMSVGYWEGTTKKDMISFSAVVGNPPYQEMKSSDKTVSNAAFASAIYPYFIDVARGLKPKYISLITPSRWMTKVGQGISSDWVDELIESKQFISIYDFLNSGEFAGLRKALSSDKIVEKYDEMRESMPHDKIMKALEDYRENVSRISVKSFNKAMKEAQKLADSKDKAQG